MTPHLLAVVADTADRPEVSLTSRVGLVLLGVILICAVYDGLIVHRIRQARDHALDQRDDAYAALERLERRLDTRPVRQVDRARPRRADQRTAVR